MNKQEILKKVEKLVRKHMMGEGTGHDWWHVDRVRRNALEIFKLEKKGDPFIIQLAALMHDLDDWKFRKSESPVNTLQILKKSGVNYLDQKKILEITENISFKHDVNLKRMTTWEGMIVQDDDRLDAIGAIGIARLFAFGGSVGKEIYNPEKKVVLYKSAKQFKWATNASLHHFQEKLLLLKNRMNTRSGRKLAQRRHRFMVEYLKEFHREWKGLR